MSGSATLERPSTFSATTAGVSSTEGYISEQFVSAYVEELLRRRDVSDTVDELNALRQLDDGWDGENGQAIPQDIIAASLYLVVLSALIATISGAPWLP